MSVVAISWECGLWSPRPANSYRLGGRRVDEIEATMADRLAKQVSEGAGDPAVERFLEGDAETIAEALRITRLAVNHRGFYVPSQERGELVQETLLALLRQLSDPARPRPKNFEAFVRTLAYRRCVDWMRRMPRERDPVPEELPTDDASAEASMLW